MAFSTNLRGLRSVAMAVLVSSSIGYAQEPAVAEVNQKSLEKNKNRAVAGKAGMHKASSRLGAKV